MTLGSPRRGCRVAAFRASLLVTLVLQNTAYVIFTKLSFQDAKRAYIVSTVILCAEFAKLLVSSVMLITLHGLRAFGCALKELPVSTGQLCLPSALYTVQSRLIFEGVRSLNPTIFIACSQVKIFTTAWFSFCLLGKAITRVQFFALCLLVVGLLLVQVEANETPTDKGNVDGYRTVYGMIMVCTAATTSGFSGAYLEKIYRGDCNGGYKNSIWFKNLQLALFSMTSALLSCYWQDEVEIRDKGFFVGYRSIVIAIVLLQAIGGLVVASVMKHTGNLLKCFAAAFSTCFCAILSPYLLNHTDQIGGKQFIGILLIFASTFIYTSKPRMQYQVSQ